jgi:cytochrome c peroxidase
VQGHLRGVAALALVASLSACAKDEPPPAPAAAASSAFAAVSSASAPQGNVATYPLVALTVELATRGRQAAEAMQRAPDEPSRMERYLALRRVAFEALPLFRLGAPLAAEALFGPERSANEAEGALPLLDLALASGVAKERVAELASVALAFSLAEEEVTASAVRSDAGARALSLRAYELGLLAAGGAASPPSSEAAQLADLEGTLAFLDAGLRATLALCSPPRELEAAASAAYAAIAALRERVVAAPATGLSERATFVLATGELGASLRRATGLCGWTPKLPYPARFPVRGNTADEPVSAFTLPAPRLPAPSDARPYDDPRFVALGERLFQDKALSEARDRACTTCHEPAKGFADGRARPASLTPEEAPLRHAPTLLYTSLHAAQMWDGRTLTAEDQAIGVIHARAEMGLAEGELLARLGAEPSYSAAFAALPGGLVAANVGRALAAFESTRLAPGTSPLDAFARGEANALDADARRGFDVLAGKGRCTRCHVPPSFAGSRPRDFAVPIFAALGVPTDPSGKTLDPDPGRGKITGRARDDGAFKTPTLRAIASTAPYFHNGAFATLESVVDFYDRGGGKGLGLAVPNPDPDVIPLKLSVEERRVLLLFLRRTLTEREPPKLR